MKCVQKSAFSRELEASKFENFLILPRQPVPPRVVTISFARPDIEI